MFESKEGIVNGQIRIVARDIGSIDPDTGIRTVKVGGGMGRKQASSHAMTESLTDEPTTFEQDGRTFVTFPNDMFVYEEHDGLLARVPLDGLPDAPEDPIPVWDENYNGELI